MEVTGNNLTYIIKESRKRYTKGFNKWIVDTVDKNKLNESNTVLTVYSCPGTSKADYKLIDKATNAVISSLQIDCKTVEREK